MLSLCPTMQAEADVVVYLRWHEGLRGKRRDWRDLAMDRRKWDELALRFAAHMVARLSGIVQHVRCDSDAVDGLGA